jgi:hypothetical protein
MTDKPPTDPPVNPPTDPPTDPPTNPPDDPPARCEHCDGLIGALDERVKTVEGHVQTILDIKPDSTPVKGPWFARKVGGK